MSAQRAQNIRKIEENLMVIAVALLAPVIISFIFYIVGSNVGGNTVAAGVGYGIQSVASIPSSWTCTVSTSGVSYLWATSVAGSGPCAGASLPSMLLGIVNAVLIFVGIIVALITGIRLAPSLVEFGEGQ